MSVHTNVCTALFTDLPYQDHVCEKRTMIDALKFHCNSSSAGILHQCMVNYLYDRPGGGVSYTVTLKE